MCLLQSRSWKWEEVFCFMWKYWFILIWKPVKTGENHIICIPRLVDNIIFIKREPRRFFISVNLQYRSSNHRRSQQKSHHQKNIDWNLLRHQRSRSESFASLDSQSSIHEHQQYGIWIVLCNSPFVCCQSMRWLLGDTISIIKSGAPLHPFSLIRLGSQITEISGST